MFCSMSWQLVPTLMSMPIGTPLRLATRAITSSITRVAPQMPHWPAPGRASSQSCVLPSTKRLPSSGTATCLRLASIGRLACMRQAPVYRPSSRAIRSFRAQIATQTSSVGQLPREMFTKPPNMRYNQQCREICGRGGIGRRVSLRGW